MSDEPSTRPWRVAHPGEIEDANGELLYNLRDCIGGGVDEANAALIVAAVDERERLRDIVRRAIPFIEGFVNAGSIIKADDPDIVPFLTQGQKDAARKAHEEAVPLLAEARAAVGEDKE